MKRTVTYRDRSYKVRSDRIEIPDLEALSSLEALQWLIRHTYAKGYSKPPSPLAGFGGAVKVSSR